MNSTKKRFNATFAIAIMVANTVLPVAQAYAASYTFYQYVPEIAPTDAPANPSQHKGALTLVGTSSKNVGSIPVGSTETNAVYQFYNNSDVNASLTVSTAVLSSGSGLVDLVVNNNCQDVASNTSCTVEIISTPKNSTSTGVFSGSIGWSSTIEGGGNFQSGTLVINGEIVSDQLVASSSVVDLGKINIGTGSVLGPVLLVGNHGKLPATVSFSIESSGVSSGSSIQDAISIVTLNSSGGACSSLGANESCSVQLSFNSSNSAVISKGVGVIDSGIYTLKIKSANSEVIVPIKLELIQGSVGLNVSGLNFSTVPGQVTDAKTVTLTNSSAAVVNLINAVSSSDAFVISPASISGCATISAGGSCQLSVSYNPTSAVLGQLSITNKVYEAKESAAKLNLTFTGVAANQSAQSVDLNGTVDIPQFSVQTTESEISNLFKQVVVGTSKTATVNINYSAANVSKTISGVSIVPKVSNGSDLTIDSNQCSSLSISSGSTGACAVVLKYTPSQASSNQSIGSVAWNVVLPEIVRNTAGLSSELSSSTGAAIATYNITGGGGVSSYTLSTTSGNSISFGNVQKGTTVQTNKAIITNTGNMVLDLSEITQQNSAISVSGGDYSVVPQNTDSGSCFNPANATLAVGSSCFVGLAVKPTVLGSISGSLVSSLTKGLNGSNATAQNISLSTESVAPSLVTSAPSIDLGAISINTETATQPLTITNTGVGPVDISAIVASSGLNIDYSACFTGSLPQTLDSQKSCTMTVKGTPTTKGSVTGLSVNVTSSAGTINIPVSLTGLSSSYTLSNPSMDFGTVQVGDTSIQSVQLSNTGNTSLTIASGTSGVQVTGTGYQLFADQDSANCLNMNGSLAAGATCLFKVKFSPVSALSSNPGQLLVKLGATPVVADTTVALAGSSSNPTLLIGKNQLDFNSVTVGVNANPQSFIITNSGAGSVSVTNIAVSNSNTSAADFQASYVCGSAGSAVSLPYSLTNGSGNNYCTISVSAKANARGLQAATLAITSSAGTFNIPLSINGIQTSYSVDSSIDFSTVQVGDTLTKYATLTNTGNTALTVASTDFAISGTGYTLDSSSTCFTVGSLSAGQTCTIGVKFSPTAALSSNPGSVIVSTSTTDGAGSKTIGLTAVSSVASVSVDKSVVNLSDTYVGQQSSSVDVTVSNNGYGSITVNSISTIDTDTTKLVSGYSLVCGGASKSAVTLPYTIAANSSNTCVVHVTGTPKVMGVISGKSSLTINTSAGSKQSTINVTGLQASATIGQISFGSVQNSGTVKTASTFITNSGNVSLTLNNATTKVLVGGSAVTYLNVLTDVASSSCYGLTTLAAGATCSVSVTFDPAGISSFPNNAVISSTLVDGTTSLNTNVSGNVTATMTVPTVTQDSPSVGYGNVVLTETSEKTVTFTNSGTDTITVSGASLISTDEAGTWSINTSGVNACTANQKLIANASCKVYVDFAPKSLNGKAATLSLAVAGASNLTASLTGTGVVLGVTTNPTGITFSNTLLGNTSTVSVNVSNTGGQTLSSMLFKIVDTNNTGLNAEFSAQGVAGTNPACATSLISGSACSLAVNFSPTVRGLKSGLVLRISGTSAGGTAYSKDISIANVNGIITSVTSSAPSVQLGTTSNKGFAYAYQTINNTGDTPVTITIVPTAMNNNNAASSMFAYANATAGSTSIQGDKWCAQNMVLAAGDKCGVNAGFDRTVVFTGSASMYSRVATSAGNVDSYVATSGRASNLSAWLISGNFNVPVGTKGTATFGISNPTTVPLVFNGASGIITADNVTVNQESTTCGTTLNAGGSCTVTVSYVPPNTNSVSVSYQLNGELVSWRSVNGATATYDYLADGTTLQMYGAQTLVSGIAPGTITALPATIVQGTDTYRSYSNGTVASSCNGYKNPATGYAYTGATGSGVYYVAAGAGSQAVYCDMTTDASYGWTLVYSGNSTSTSKIASTTAYNDPVGLRSHKYLSRSQLIAIAGSAQAVKLTQLSPLYTATSTNSNILANLKAGITLNANTGLAEINSWGSDAATNGYMTWQYNSGLCPASVAGQVWPVVWWSCGYNNLHILDNTGTFFLYINSVYIPGRANAWMDVDVWFR